jgi:chondroitin AC lyase
MMYTGRNWSRANFCVSFFYQQRNLSIIGKITCFPLKVLLPFFNASLIIAFLYKNTFLPLFLYNFTPVFWHIEAYLMIPVVYCHCISPKRLSHLITIKTMLMSKNLHARILCFVCCFLLVSITASSQTAYDTIIKRVDSIQRITISSGSLKTTVDGYWSTYVSSGTNAGSFSDLSYATNQDKTFPGLAHLEKRVMNFALAYTDPTISSYYSSISLYDTILAALRYWYGKNPSSTDAYYQFYRTPTALGRILCIMRHGTVPVPQALEDSVINRIYSYGGGSATAFGIDNSNEQNGGYRNVIAAALTENNTPGDSKNMTNSVNHMFSPIKYFTPFYPTRTGEGTGYQGGYQYDGSYLIHGPQPQIATYGSPSIGYMFGILMAGTQFPMPADVVNFLSNYTINTYLKAARGAYFDWQIGGRDAANSSGGPVLQALQNAKIIDPANNTSWNNAIARITQAQPASYMISPEHKHFWQADYDLHIRPGYSFNIKTVSSRTSRTERGNNTNILGRYLPDGATAIMVKGDEYANIAPIWEWDKIPGITSCDYAADKPTSVDWGQLGSTAFVGGVSDSLYGATAYDLNFDNVFAKKAWFQFDDEIVCLGAGIKSTNAEPVVSVQNQSWLRGNVTISDNGTVSTLAANSFAKPVNIQWVQHDNVGYFFPAGGDVTVSNQIQSGNWNPRINLLSSNTSTINGSVFKLWINHGSRPAGAKYAYIVAPGLGNTSAMQAYDQSKIRIVTNSDTAQAVRHLGLDIMQIVFYKAGAVTDSTITVSVSKPCIVQLKNLQSSSVTMHIADPTNNTGDITVALRLPALSGTKQLTVSLPSGNYAGSSKRVIIDNSIATSNLYRSKGTGVTVDLASATNWQNYNGSTWVDASVAPSGNLVATDTIIVRPNDTWQNNTAATSIPAGAVLIDSSALFGTFSTTSKFTNNGTVIFSGSSLQTIPGQSAIGLAGNGGGSSWGNLIINNPAGVTSTQNGNYFHVKDITLQSGTFTAGSSGGLSFYIDGKVTAGGGNITSSATGTNFGTIMSGVSAQVLPAGIFPSNTVANLQIGFLGQPVSSAGPLIISSLLRLQKGTVLSNSGNISITNLTIDSLITGTAPITVTGTATLGGTVTVSRFSGIPFISQKIVLVNTTNITGAFTATAVLPTGYTGTIANEGNKAVLTITSSPYTNYRSRTTGGTNLATAGDWQIYNGSTWVTATTAPTAAPANSTILIRNGHTWQNTIASAIPAGVTLVDSSSLFGTFSTTSKLTNNGTIVFCGSSLQTIPGQSSLGLNYNGGTGGGSWGNLIISNTAGVSSTQTGGNYVHVKSIALQSGTFTGSAGSGVTLFIDSTIARVNGNMTTNPTGGTNFGINMYGISGPQIIPVNTFVGNTVSRLTINNAQGVVSDGALTISGFLNLTIAGAGFTGKDNFTTNGLSITSLNSSAVPVIVMGTATLSGTVTITSFSSPAYNGKQITLLDAGNISGGFNATPVLPAGYTGTITNIGNNVVLTITSSFYGNYRSLGTGVTVDLASANNWQIYDGSAWVAATIPPGNNALPGTTITIRAADTWQNNIAATNIPYAVTLIDSSSLFGTFSTSAKLGNAGTVVFSGSSLQTIPGAASLSATSISGGGGSWGNLVINNAAGVTAAQSTGNYLHISDINLQSGIFTASGTGGVTLFIDGAVSRGSGKITTNAVTGTNFGVTMYGLANGTQSLPAGAFVNDTISRFTVNNSNGVSVNGSLKAVGVLTLSGAGATLTTTGNLEMGSLSISSLGNSAITSTGTVTLDGTLSVTGFANTPTVSQQFTVISAGLVQNSFDSLKLPAGYSGTMSYTSTTAVLTVTGIPGGSEVVTNNNKQGQGNLSIAKTPHQVEILQSLETYPNPVIGYCTIRSKKAMRSITVYDISGRSLQTVANINAIQYTLQLKNAVAGTLYLRITGDGYEQTKKILKMRE